MNSKKIKYDVFIKGQKIDLVVLNEEIIEFTKWYNWFNDSEITSFMQKHYYPNSKEVSYLGETATMHFKPSKSLAKNCDKDA